MQKENLEKRNREWISKIYQEKRKDYSRMLNIGWYRDLLSVDDLINDAYITFSTYNDLKEFDGTYEHLRNLFNQFIYWAQTASYNKRSKVVQKWKSTSQYYEFNNSDKDQEGTINLRNLTTTPYPEMLEIEKEMNKQKYQLLKMYLAGYTCNELAYVLGFSRTTIMKYVDIQANELKQKYIGDVKLGNKNGIRDRGRKSIPVIDTSTNKTYISAKEAYDKGNPLAKSYKAFTRMLSGEQINKTNFEYVNQSTTVDK
jgi:hypothetical protein